MKNTKLIALISLIAISLILSGCFIRKEKCSWKKPLVKYKVRPQGLSHWNYKKHMGPKRKLK